MEVLQGWTRGELAIFSCSCRVVKRSRNLRRNKTSNSPIVRYLCRSILLPKFLILAKSPYNQTRELHLLVRVARLVNIRLIAATA